MLRSFEREVDYLEEKKNIMKKIGRKKKFDDLQMGNMQPYH